MTLPRRSKSDIISYKMSRVRAKNTGIELRMAAIIRKYRLKGYRRNALGILGTPDFCWKKEKLAVFCDSSFWHGYDWKNQIRTIKTRKTFWVNKIETNIKRDKSVTLKLRRQGWRVLRFWDFEIKRDVDRCVDEIRGYLESISGLNGRSYHLTGSRGKRMVQRRTAKTGAGITIEAYSHKGKSRKNIPQTRAELINGLMKLKSNEKTTENREFLEKVEKLAAG